MQVSHQDRMHILTERRKLQMEIESKRHQLEDDRRALQHLKSKSLRERWLLDSESSGQDQDQEGDQDLCRTRDLKDNIYRLEQELLSLEAEVCRETITHISVTSGPVPDDREVTELKVQTIPKEEEAMEAMAEVRGQKIPQISEDMKRAMYSVQITVERDNLTGETRVLSSSKTLPAQTEAGVKVYEDTHRVVHEVDGKHGDNVVHLLSSSDVDKLLLQADQVATAPPTIATAPPTIATAPPIIATAPPIIAAAPPTIAAVPSTIATADSGSSALEVGGASVEHPVTMVFMGYQDVEDEDETKRMLGLQGVVRAERVLLQEDTPTTAAASPATPPAEIPVTTTPITAASAEHRDQPAATVPTPTPAVVTPALATPTDTKAVPVTKEKKPLCRCCSIM